MKPALFLSFVCYLLVCTQGQRKTPHCDSGRTGQVIVHLFSWRWKDIALECEKVLGPKGFCGVQVSPPNEHVIITNPHRPWWERYQPVSYKLDSASGSRAEFIDMVDRCNAVGVKIYIDAVINHMVGGGSGTGTGGSYYNYDLQKYDGVPYGPNDFGKRCNTHNGQIGDYSNADEVRNCALLGLADLEGGSDYVRGKIAAYFDDMLTIGIDGYRIDAAKHMWPGDLDATIAKTKRTKTGDVPFVYQEVIDLSGSESIKSSDYQHIGRVTEFKYGIKLAETFLKNQIALTHLKTFGSSWGMLADGDAFVFVDNHDNQRGHGGGGSVITYKQSRAYKMAVAFMLSWPYGVPRIMSSYQFTDDSTGPPSGAPGSSGLCQNGWICEHRWRQILNMVAWRNSAGGNGVANWWSNGNNQMAFSRGSASFIVFNKNDGMMNENLNTGLPSGTYCDIISGNLENGQCTGKEINVGADSTAEIQIDGSDENPFIAIHVGSKKDGSSGPSPTQPPQPSQPPTGMQRTIVFLKKTTSPGQNVFLRGGCGNGDCSVPITYPSPRQGSRFNLYNAWSNGDTELDWNGAEQGQGHVNGVRAQGSPMVWTDSDSTSPSYVAENTYGDHYWMWDVYMDCSDTTGGYFAVKGYSDGWESDISQTACTGETGSHSLNTKNHIAKCGAKNVFEWNSPTCIMEPL